MRLGVNRRAGLEQFKQSRLDDDSLVRGLPIDPADFTGRAKDRELIFQAVDQVQRFQADFRRMGVLTCIEENLELAGHRAA